ncbi:unnamed protein product [Durusdinium trenchii]|uniref:Uncharacterized protein n=1 Tax=Durusdinium trenchii TaxID=1381693 RepID=A0ABP0Q7V3_9DINO
MAMARMLGVVCGVALGVFAFVETQKVMAKDPAIQKFQKFCIAGNATALEQAGLHDYEPMLGGPFICILTNFVYVLAAEPAGLLVWGLISTLVFPLTLLIYAEAGRGGAKGPVKWPIMTLLLGQLLGISVIFPSFWVPSALLGQGSGSTVKGRVWMAMFLVLPITLVEAFVFFGDAHSYPENDGRYLVDWHGLEEVFVANWEGGYYFLIYQGLQAFSTSADFLDAIWGPKAHGSVAFMTVDSGALLLYVLMTCDTLSSILALLLTPLLGPGCAVAFALARRERMRLAELAGEGRQVDGWTLPFAILVNDGREAQQHNGSVKLDVKVAKVGSSSQCNDVLCPRLTEEFLGKLCECKPVLPHGSRTPPRHRNWMRYSVWQILPASTVKTLEIESSIATEGIAELTEKANMLYHLGFDGISREAPQVSAGVDGKDGVPNAARRHFGFNLKGVNLLQAPHSCHIFHTEAMGRSQSLPTLLSFCLGGVAFFDFFATQKDAPEKGEVPTASYGQLKVLNGLRKWDKAEERWTQYSRETGFSDSTMPANLVQDFILQPENYKTNLLKSFASLAKLPSLQVDADEDEMEYGGFMDSNRFGMVKSDKQLEAQQAELAGQVRRFIAAKSENAAEWESFCLDRWDPDDADSRAVRGEMASRSELGRRKTALESWLDAETGKAPPSGEKWGV